MNADRKSNKAVSAIIVVVLLGVVAAGGTYLKSTGTDSQTSQTQMASIEKKDDKSSKKATNAENYKDGKYQAEGTYTSPAGQEKIKVELTISDNKISKANVVSEAEKYSATQRYQEDFIGGYKKQVVGKSVNDIKLDRVAGSSLTPNGFNAALEMIKSDAAA